MGKLTKAIIWTALFLVMMLAIDQFFVQVPPIHPAHKAVTDFYRDFRGRVIDLAFDQKKKAPKSIEAVIDKTQSKKDTPSKSETSAQKTADSTKKETVKQTQRYIYSDGKGELHFVESLQEVPDEYRAQAQPMSR
jgi:hypothetical protein